MKKKINILLKCLVLLGTMMMVSGFLCIDTTPKEYETILEPLPPYYDQRGPKECGIATVTMWMGYLYRIGKADRWHSYWEVYSALGEGPHENSVLAEYITNNSDITAQEETEWTFSDQFRKIGNEIINDDQPVIQTFRLNEPPDYPTHNMLVEHIFYTDLLIIKSSL